MSCPPTHSPVKQDPYTAFKINPEDWNNVPKIIYDCLSTVINRLDIHVNDNRKFKQDTMKEIKDLSDLIEDQRRLIEDAQEMMKKQAEEDQKKV